MLVQGFEADEKKIAVEMDMVEAGHLLSFLLHAKFSDDVRHEIVGSPTMQTLLSGLIQSALELGETDGWPADIEGWEIREEGGLNAPPAFAVIEARLKSLLKKDDVGPELKASLYPFKWVKRTD